MSVCLSVCLFACLSARMSQKTVQTLRSFSVNVICGRGSISSDKNSLGYILLWMTSCVFTWWAYR